MKKLATILLLSIPLHASAQPYSVSMAECAALYQNAAQWVTADDRADKLLHATRQWANAAQNQAKAEGRDSSEAEIWEMINTKTEAWEAKGAQLFFTQDFRDWMAYCRSFAKDRGINLGL